MTCVPIDRHLSELEPCQKLFIAGVEGENGEASFRFGLLVDSRNPNKMAPKREIFTYIFFQMVREKRLSYEFTRPLPSDHIRCKLRRWNYVMIIILDTCSLLGLVTHQNMTEQITKNTRNENTHIAHANHTSPSFSDPFPPTRRDSFTWNPNRKQRRVRLLRERCSPS